MSHVYNELIAQPLPLVREGACGGYQLFTERHMQALWFEQRYMRSLCTAEDAPIEVLSPGLWNGEAGPDFLKAHLRIGGIELRGDIELHLNDESWSCQGHQTDPRYGNVVLHLSLWKPRDQRPLLRCDGTPINHGYLEDRLTVSLARLVQLIDLDLYPYRKFVGSGKCAHSLFNQLPEGKIADLLASAAMHRIEAKRRLLKSQVTDPHLIPAAAIAMALGYKMNASVFLELFLWLWPMRSLTGDQRLAMALGAGGFFGSVYFERWKESEKYIQLSALWEQEKARVLRPFAVTVGQQRPLHHPVRRLVCLVALAGDDRCLDLLEVLDQVWQQEWRQCGARKRWGPLLRQLMDTLPDYHDPYWNSHYLFEKEESKGPLPLLGGEVKFVAFVNGLLPMLFSQVQTRADPAEYEAMNNFYGTLNAPVSGKRRYLTHRFFGEEPKGALLRRSIHEQGAFQIHRDFCLHYEASCEGCPFVERVYQTRAGTGYSYVYPNNLNP